MSSIATALHDLLDREVPLLDAVDRHFAADYRQRTDGVWGDRKRFVQHIAHLRTVVELIGIDVREELREGPTYAERHVVRLRKPGGGRIEQEVYVFGEIDADGRFRRIEETTLQLDGDESDRGIGSAR